MSTSAVPSPGGHTYTQESRPAVGLCLLVSDVRGKERNREPGMDQICPQVSGMGEKGKEKKASKPWLNTIPGEPCKLRNSSFTNSKGK